jgi:hypothetical protein
MIKEMKILLLFLLCVGGSFGDEVLIDEAMTTLSSAYWEEAKKAINDVSYIKKCFDFAEITPEIYLYQRVSESARSYHKTRDFQDKNAVYTEILEEYETNYKKMKSHEKMGAKIYLVNLTFKQGGGEYGYYAIANGEVIEKFLVMIMEK